MSMDEFSNDEIWDEIVARSGNYVSKIRDMLAAGSLPAGTGITDVDIFHDAWCGIYGNKPCNCDPEIHLRGIPQ